MRSAAAGSYDHFPECHALLMNVCPLQSQTHTPLVLQRKAIIELSCRADAEAGPPKVHYQGAAWLLLTYCARQEPARRVMWERASMGR